MRILGIETSCDETAAAIVEDGQIVRCSVISSQWTSFAQCGGVIPEQAARQQVLCMIPVLRACLKEARMTPESVDAIAVTKGPGLLGSLLIGTTTARTLAALWRKPLIGVHHTLGHLSSTFLSESKMHVDRQQRFPILTLSASGGHTDLWHRTSHTRGTLIGSTRDDAAGEAFDKGARLLGLPYPGGPSIAKAAENGDSTAHTFPLPLREDPSLDFSFSGLKTSLRYLLSDLGFPAENGRYALPDIAASYQCALCDHLIDRMMRALHRHKDIREVHIVGGVSANTHLRSSLHSAMQKKYPNVTLRHPSKLAYCTDNAAMIAAAGEFLVQEYGERAYESFETTASLPLAMAVTN
jgi:N6-L-threonylcarbamoyladenine synthase